MPFDEAEQSGGGSEPSKHRAGVEVGRTMARSMIDGTGYTSKVEVCTGCIDIGVAATMVEEMIRNSREAGLNESQIDDRIQLILELGRAYAARPAS